MPLAAIWIDLEIILLHEVRQIKISYDITYMWNLKIVQVNLFTEQKVTNVENKFMVTRGKRWRGIIWEIEIDTYITDSFCCTVKLTQHGI